MFKLIMKLHKCDNCVIRCNGLRKHRSLFARIHRWHATWWPGWKLYRAQLADRAAKSMPRA